MTCYAFLLWFAMLYCAMFCYRILARAVLCYAWLRCDFLCFALFCPAFAALCYAMLCYVLLSFELLCYALLRFAVHHYGSLRYDFAVLCCARLCIESHGKCCSVLERGPAAWGRRPLRLCYISPMLFALLFFIMFLTAFHHYTGKTGHWSWSLLAGAWLLIPGPDFPPLRFYLSLDLFRPLICLYTPW